MSRLDKIREIVLENILEGKEIGICHHVEEYNPLLKQVVCCSSKLGTTNKLVEVFTSYMRCNTCSLNHKNTWFRFEEETFYGLPTE